MTGGGVPSPASAPFDPIALGTEIQRRIGVKTSRDEPLARFTTMRVGGPADLFAVAHNAFELRALVKLVREPGHRPRRPRAGQRRRHRRRRDPRSRHPGPGRGCRDPRRPASSPRRASRWPGRRPSTQGAGLSGLEFGLAIPGTVGGAVWANAGAHDADVRAVLEGALVMTADGTEARLDPAGLGLGYRDSRLKHPVPGAPAEVVVGATFRLQPASADEIRDRLDEIRRWRQAHQPLGIPSAGSYFRNPAGDSAGRLIDAAGLKGTRVGGASVSEKHANFLVNDRKGTAADVRRLGERVRAEVARGSASSSRRRSSSSATGGPNGRRARHDRGSRRSSSCSAARRPSTTSRSSPATPSPTPWRTPATRSRGSSSTSTAAGGGCRPVTGAATAGRPPTTIRPPSGRTDRCPPAAAVDRLAGVSPTPVVFVALHGPFGEDGTVQALLEAAGLAYTGSGVTASAIGMDKAVFKRLCRGLGLPVVDWREVGAARWTTDRDGVLAELEAFAASTGDPRLMVKPARLGSSVGMTLAHAPAERPAAIETALAHDTLALVEAYLAGARDLEVSVIGNDPARLELYGPGEIVAGHEFYDYAAKYTPGLSETSPVAELEPAIRATILKIARDCYRAIGAEGFARVDFLLAAGGVYLSEINTIPGFTPISLFPAMAADGGYTFAGVAERIVELALERQAGRGPAPAPSGRPAPMTTRRGSRGSSARRRPRPVGGARRSDARRRRRTGPGPWRPS